MYPSAVPVPVSGKDDYSGYQSGHSPYSASGSASYGHSGRSANASYTGRMQGDMDASTTGTEVDFNEYIRDHFRDHFSPAALDKSVKVQTDTSDALTAKRRQLQEMEQKSKARLAKMRARIASGLRDARDVRADLEWSQHKLTSMTEEAEKKYPKEYKKAKGRYDPPLDLDY